MARVSEQEIERLKAEISVERLAMRAGVELKAQGKDLLGRCPFHDDKTPSLVISPEKNLWHCLGACQAGGSVIDWVMRAEGVSFRHAVELLRSDIPSLAAEVPKGRGSKVAKHSTTQKLTPLVDASVSEQELLGRVVSYYTETLKGSPEALSYLESRGLRNSEIIERFRLGYADRSLGYRLPAKNRKEGAEVRGKLQELGILRKTGHEHLRGSITVPIFDEQGRLVEMYGRKVGERLRKGTPDHLYLPGPHRGVFNIHAFFASKDVILCESLIDALTFWCAGYRNVTCAYGVEGFGADHWEALKKHEIKRVLIAYDRDEAGDRAAEKLATELTAAGIEAFRVKFPKGMDANEYALKVGPAEKSLGAALRSAEWMGQGKAPERAVPELKAVILEQQGELGRADESEDKTPPLSPPPAEPGEAAKKKKDETLQTSPALRSETETSAPESRDQDCPGGTELPDDAPQPPEASPVSSKEPESPGQLSSLVAERPSPPERPESQVSADELVITMGNRRWRVRGLSKNTSGASLKVNLLITHSEDGTFHVDTLELYSARQRAAYIKQASEELMLEERILKKDLGQLLLKLEEAQEKRGAESETAPQKVELTETEKKAALELLRDPRLLERITEDLGRCGLIGETTNKLTAYLAATSRMLERPLAIVVQSSSAAGKSSLMDAVLRMMPEEERVSYSAMTGQSLFYMGETNLSHKILSIAEEEGAERASYALKLLQSEGELTIASTGKDPATGRLITQEYRVEGPVMIFLTTTAIEVDEELLNRCIVLTVDENREQTHAIHEQQRQARTLSGVMEHQARSHVMRLHQNAQRLLRPLYVVNPYASQLTFPDHQTRLRRDHMKYLSLIDTVALLHQYQRPVKSVEHEGRTLRYIEVSREDIRVANELSHEVLGRTLDELPPQTRRLLLQLDELVGTECEKRGLEPCDFRFSRRDVRERLPWGDTQLKVHLGRLVELELLMVHRGRQGQGYEYELCYSAKQERAGAYLPGLIDPNELSDASTTPTSRGRGGDFAGPGRGSVGGESGPSRGDVRAISEGKTRVKKLSAGEGDENARHRSRINGASYSKHHISSLAASAAPAVGEA